MDILNSKQIAAQLALEYSTEEDVGHLVEEAGDMKGGAAEFWETCDSDEKYQL